MGDVVNIKNYQVNRADCWQPVLTVDSNVASLQVYVNPQTREAEIVQSNNDGTSIRTVLCPSDRAALGAALLLGPPPTTRRSSA